MLDDKPAGAIDECWIGAALTETTDAAACAAAFPYYGDARLGAGESMVDNAMQCQLKPLDPADYAVTFTADQWARLQAGVPGRRLRLDRAAARLEEPFDPVADVRDRPGRDAARLRAGLASGPAALTHPGPGPGTCPGTRFPVRLRAE